MGEEFSLARRYRPGVRSTREQYLLDACGYYSETCFSFPPENLPGRRPMDDGPSAPQAQRSRRQRLAPVAEAQPKATTMRADLRPVLYCQTNITVYI